MSSPSWVPISGCQNYTKTSRKPFALIHPVKGLTQKNPFIHNFVPKFFNITFYRGRYIIWNYFWVHCIKIDKKSKHEILSILGIFWGPINGKMILANLFYLMNYSQGYNLLSFKKEQQKETTIFFNVKAFGWY